MKSPTTSERGATPPTFLLDRVIEASARNRFLVFVLVLGFLAAGLWAMKRTPLDAIPDLSDVQVISYSE